MSSRPPIGFIVEGYGEFNCYPSLISKIAGAVGFKIPIVNAGGCGSLIKRLGDQLTDLFLADSPENVVVTVDLKDALSQGLASSHEDLIRILNSAATKWMTAAAADSRLHPLPNKVSCLAQVRKFESWLIADIQGLKDAHLVRQEIEQPADAEAIEEPVAWLHEALKSDVNIKSPSVVKQAIGTLNHEVMVVHSQSFSHFHDACAAMYQEWLTRFF